MEDRSSRRMRTLVTQMARRGLSVNEVARALISMMARSTTRSNQRPDTLMQDRICQVDETSCNARPDHTFGSKPEKLNESKCFPLFTQQRTSPRYFGISVSCQQATSITDGGSVTGDRKLKESTSRLAPGRPQPPTMGFDNRAADRQPKPQTARFRGVETLEHALKSRRCEA